MSFDSGLREYHTSGKSNKKSQKRSCSFFDNDCDFAAHIETAPPCGGFIFLSQLVSEEIIKVEDMDCLKR